MKKLLLISGLCLYVFAFGFLATNAYQTKTEATKAPNPHVQPTPEQTTIHGTVDCKKGTHPKWVVNKEWDKVTGICVPDVTPTPTATPTAVPEPTVTSTPNAVETATSTPKCEDGTTVQLPANVHVVRDGSKATVNFFITEGDSANIFYKEVNASTWQHALADVKPNQDKFVSQDINGLDANLGYTFGVQQKKGCGTGQLVTAVVVDDPLPTVFPMSYWTW